jgi:hypothetical protein
LKPRPVRRRPNDNQCECCCGCNLGSGKRILNNEYGIRDVIESHLIQPPLVTVRISPNEQSCFLNDPETLSKDQLP